MSINQLLNHLAQQADPPIIVDDIRDWIIEHRFQDQIEFIAGGHGGNDRSGRACTQETRAVQEKKFKLRHYHNQVVSQFDYRASAAT